MDPCRSNIAGARCPDPCDPCAVDACGRKSKPATSKEQELSIDEDDNASEVLYAPALSVSGSVVLHRCWHPLSLSCPNHHGVDWTH